MVNFEEILKVTENNNEYKYVWDAIVFLEKVF